MARLSIGLSIQKVYLPLIKTEEAIFKSFNFHLQTIICYMMLSDIGLSHCENILCSMAFTFLISCMKWSDASSLAGETSKATGKQVLPAKWEMTAGKGVGNLRDNDFKLRVI